jgi:hypothetical protein
MDVDLNDAQWRKSSSSGGGDKRIGAMTARNGLIAPVAHADGTGSNRKILRVRPAARS